VGNIGNGSLSIRGGGTVSNVDGYVGFNNNTTGSATVSDDGSTWTNSGLLQLGAFGNGSMVVEKRMADG
jgi:T5SS/PEP-CTERM-associated repeat protein